MNYVPSDVKNWYKKELNLYYADTSLGGLVYQRTFVIIGNGVSLATSYPQSPSSITSVPSSAFNSLYIVLSRLMPLNLTSSCTYVSSVTSVARTFQLEHETILSHIKHLPFLSRTFWAVSSTRELKYLDRNFFVLRFENFIRSCIS